jgi:polyhydroxybutyrate depolymerase
MLRNKCNADPAVRQALGAALLAGAVGVSCSDGGPDAGRDLQETITVDGRVREYELHIPAGYKPLAEAPLIVAIHPSTPFNSPPTIQAMRDVAQFDRVADSMGFIVAYPQATDDWAEGCGCTTADTSGVDDVAFVLAMLDSIVASWSVDEDRVFAVGLSSGGLFAERLGCDAANRFSGVAAVSTTMSEPLSRTCRPARPVSMLLMAGTQDRFFPFERSPPRRRSTFGRG